MAKKEYPYLEYRCDLLKFGRVMTDELRADITQEKLVLIQRTPFGSLFMAYYNGTLIESACKKSDLEIVALLKCFNQQTKSFKFGEFTGTITSKDISELFGLTLIGEEINLDQKKKKEDDGFRTRQLGGVPRMSKAILEQKIKHVAKLRGIEDEKDFVRLVCLYFCVTLFLCNSGNELGWNVLPYIEDIETMSQYAWAPLVCDHLMESIMKMNGRPETACGCVIALPFWFCERTLFIEPMRGRGAMEPKIVKWNLPELYARMKVGSILEIEVMERDEDQSTNVVLSGEKLLVEIGTTSGTKSREQKNATDFDPYKMFQLLPTQFYLEESQERPSSNEKDVPELEKRVQEFADLLEVERAKNETLSAENLKLCMEIGLLRQAIPKDEIPNVNSRKLRTKEQCKKPSFLEGYIIGDIRAKRGKEKIIDEIGDGVVEEPAVKKGKKQTVGQQIIVRRLRVGKLMSQVNAEKLKEYLSKGSRSLLWHGAHSKVTYKDALEILHEEAVSRQVMDAYFEILSLDQQAMTEGGITSYILPTFSWDMVKGGDKRAIVAAYLEHILKNIRDKDFICIPIVHEKENHVTLLVLNTKLGWWEHYNSLRPKRATTLDPSFVEAEKLHAEMTKHFTFLKTHRKGIINSGQIWKHVMRGGEVKLFQYKLSNEDRNLLIWLGGNSVEHFPIRPNKECPQQDSGSVDCAIGVMYIVKKLSKGKVVDSTFTKGLMPNMRAHILERFLNMPNGA